MDVFEKVDENAAQFSNTLMRLAAAIDGDIEKVIRLGVLKLFSGIIKRSPVDTGAYRASHGITNDEPGEREGIREGGDTFEIGSWSWEIGDGMIYIFNNQPYAARLEDGWSKQAPAGVYAVALAEFNQIFQEELNKIDRLE